MFVTLRTIYNCSGIINVGTAPVVPFSFTKSKVLSVKNIVIAILLMPTFLASSVSNEAFSGVLPCEESYPVEYYHYAAVIYSESRGEGENGMVAVLSALRNGAHGYKVGRLEPEIVELVAGEMKKDVGHRFRHWIQLESATDIRQKKIALKAIRKGEALRVGSHWFY